MKLTTLTFAGLLWVAATGLHAQVVIGAFDGNGQLTATVPTNADFSVEWASSLVPAPVWRNSWVDLTGIHASNGTTTVEVPMFYRVSCWTNGLLARAPVGRTYAYGLTNAFGQSWSESVSRVGSATIPAMTNNYMIIHAYEHWTGDQPAGANPEPQIDVIRLTDKSLFVLEMTALAEFEIWRMDDVGTSWTNFDTVVTVEAYEDVTVPAGTFTNCIRMHQRDVLAVGSNTGMRVWIKPGLIEVKSIQYADWTDPPEAAPVVSQLQSWLDE